MRIDTFSAVQRYQNMAKKSNSAEQKNETSAKEKRDTLSISSTGKQQAVSDAQKLIDRQAKVETIKEQVAAGTYQISSRAVAESIIDHIASERP